ncbi:MAG: septal ring lytic transglycosylase RlpA family protein [Actinomycetota bacterium]|nr:septal ring lytic transglycosylase RlpA family protein [Actinomycetota bacterium]
MFHNATSRSATYPLATRLPLVIAAIAILTAALAFAGGATASTGETTQTTQTGQTGQTGSTGVTGPVGESPVGGESESGLRDRNPVRLKLPRKRARFGQAVKVRGTNGLASPGRVRIQLRVRGGKGWHNVARLKARSNGRFQGTVPARFSGRLRALDVHGRASRTVKLKVRSITKLKKVARTVRLGQKLRVAGTVRPRGARTVKVRIKGGGKSVKVRTRANGRFAFRWNPRKAGDVRIRARVLPDRLATGDGSGARRVSALRPGGASFFGPGLYGNGVACGGTLTPGTRGVAHKSLPCGTKVTIQYGKRLVTARVIDRGPYIAGRDWDLTTAVRNELGFGGVGTVWTNR